MSNIIRWGHFSDLHFQFNETFQTIVLRDKLIKKLNEDNIKFDFIVITGDIGNRGDFSNDTLEFIDSILTQTGCNKDDLFITCGNHDIERNDTRSEFILKQREKKKLDINYSIDDYSLKILFNIGHEKFIDTYNKLTGKTHGKCAHFIEERKNYNIYNINTCILSGQNGEEGTLSVCDKHLIKLTKNNSSNQNKLNIAIGHHGIDCIHKSEQNQLISLLDDMNIDIYLCGHNHELGFEKWDSSKNHISQFMCGGIFKDSYNSPSFIITEYDVDSYSCTTTIYSYSTNNLNWNIMFDARYPFENGIYHFNPKRLKSKISYKDTELAVSYENTSKFTRVFDAKDIPNIDFDNTYSNILSMQSLKSNNVLTKIENKNNIFQNNLDYIYSLIHGIEEKYLILCDRLYNKFYENSRYIYLKYLKSLFPSNDIIFTTLDNDMCQNIVDIWYELLNELLNDSLIEPVNVNNSSYNNAVAIIIKLVMQNYDALFTIASNFVLNDNISDTNMLNHLNLTKKIILEENNCFFGFNDQVNSLMGIVSRKESGYFCIKADEGYGKTSLLSKLIGCIMENNLHLNGNKIENILPWLPNVIVVFGKQAADINIAVKMIVEQANMLLVNPISYDNNTTTQNFHSILYTTFEALSIELGGIVIVLDAVDEFKANNLSFLPEILPKGITVFISARKFTHDYNNGKRNITNIKHSGFTNKDETAILDFYNLSINQKNADKFIKSVLKKTNGWPLIVCDIKKQLEKVDNDFTKVKIESSLNSVFYRKKSMWKENCSTNCCTWKLLELFSVFAPATYLSKNNIQSYLLTDSNYSCMNSEEIEIILDSVSDQLIYDEAGIYKLKYASFAEYITDNKTGFTTIELRKLINNIVYWLCNNIDDNIEIIIPFYIAWRDNTDKQVKDSVESIISLLIDNNKYEMLTLIARLLMAKNKIDLTIERCLKFALNEDNNAKLLYANYLYDIVKTDTSKRNAIDLYKELSEAGNLKALLIYVDMLRVGTEYVEIDEELALKLLNKVEDNTSNNVYGMKYNIFSNINSKFYNLDESINILHKLIDKNDPEGMMILGSKLIRGDGIDCNSTEGEILLRKAANSNYKRAMVELGCRLIDGRGLKQNILEGEQFLRKAVDADYKQAMAILGSRLISGNGFKQDIPEGEKYLRKAANNGYIRAMGELGSRLIDGRGLKQNISEGEKYLRKAANDGYIHAMGELGSRLIDGRGLKQNILEGEKFLRKAADSGDTQSIAVLGSRLIDGRGLKQNILEGEKYLRKTADSGDTQSIAALGSRLIDGQELEQNILEGERLLRKAADSNHIPSIAELGSRLIDGRGLKQNILEGERLLRKAAGLGHMPSIAELGSLLIDGDVIKQNILEGERLLRKAADSGHIPSIAALGFRLINGYGIDENILDGVSLCVIASNKGHVESNSVLGMYYYNIKDFKQSIDFFTKGMSLGDKLCKINMSYMIRKGLYPNYSGTPNIEELLSDLTITNKHTFALINYSLYLISNLNINVDWIKADHYISLINYSNINELDSVISWWLNLSNKGDLEGDLILGWLCLRGNIPDPSGLLIRDRFAKSKQLYDIPNWLIEQANK